MRISARGRTSLTARALLEPLSVFAGPDVLNVPRVLDNGLPAIHKLLSVGDLELDGGAIVGQVRAVLRLLIDDKTNVELPVLLGHFHDGLIEVQPVDVELTCHLNDELQVVDEIPAEVAQGSGFLVGVCRLLVLPASLDHWFLELEAPILLVLKILAKDAAIFARGCTHNRAGALLEALLVEAYQLLARLGELRERNERHRDGNRCYLCSHIDLIINL